MLISSSKLENGSAITPLFNFFRELGLHLTKDYCFLQQDFQPVVDSRREGDENSLSGVVAEAMKFLGF